MDLNSTNQIQYFDFIVFDVSTLYLFLWTVISVIIITGNALVVFVSIKNNMHEHMNRRILLSLSVVDFATGIFGLSWIVIDKAPETEATTIATSIIYQSMWLCNSLSQWHILLLACERYIAIVYPLRYLQLASNKRVNFAIILAWICGTMICLCATPLAYFVNNKAYFFSTDIIIQLLTFICLSFSHIKVYIEAKRQVSKISSIENQLRHEKVKKRKKEYRATKTTMVVYGAYLVCYCPYIIYIIPSCILLYINHGTALLNSTLIHYLLMLLYANAGMNPVIYSYRNGSFMRNVIDSLIHTLGIRTTVNT
ncbi:histamine H2 receptor-like [Anneissia japonica]|uniref:histamine H2 receptor-like n=1 Tax=Anneissia japonica TaxID=1529436 RepID=UPI0014256444|nr:histamine H2 receptor-like [Anneissia japonica]